MALGPARGAGARALGVRPAATVGRAEQLPVQGAQFGARVGAEAVGQQLPYGLVRGEGLGGAARVAQGAQAQDVQGLVQGVEVAQGGELGQGLFGVAEGEGRGEPGAPYVEAAGLPAGRLGGAVREVREGRPVPQGEGVVEGLGRLRGVAVGKRAYALPASRSKRCRSMSSAPAASR